MELESYHMVDLGIGGESVCFGEIIMKQVFIVIEAQFY